MQSASVGVPAGIATCGAAGAGAEPGRRGPSVQPGGLENKSPMPIPVCVKTRANSDRMSITPSMDVIKLRMALLWMLTLLLASFWKEF